MPFTEEDMLEQQKTFAEMKERFLRITSRFEGLMQEMGWTDESLKQVNAEPMTPELKALTDKADEEASRAGAASAAQFEAQRKNTAPPSRRTGIIRL